MLHICHMAIFFEARGLGLLSSGYRSVANFGELTFYEVG